MYLTQPNRVSKLKEIQEFRENVLPKYLKMVKDLDKVQQRRLLYDQIMANMK